MLFNLLTILGFLVFLLLLVIAIKNPFGKYLIKILSIILIIFKISYYVITNLSGSFNYPIEISAITYFLFSLVYIFEIKKAYHIASFLGMISGLGFFLFYGFFGFLSPFSFNLFNVVVAIYSHGVVLIGGLYLFYQYSFPEVKKHHLIIAMLLIICHAAIFQLDSHLSSTFISIIIRPDYYLGLSNSWFNHLIKLVIYIILFSIFQILVNRFFYWNHYLHDIKTESN